MHFFDPLLKAVRTWFSRPWYPLAISAYPVLYLLSANAGQVNTGALLRPLIISVLFGALLFLLTRLYFREIHRAAFLTTLLLLLFVKFAFVSLHLGRSQSLGLLLFDLRELYPPLIDRQTGIHDRQFDTLELRM